MGCSRGVWPRPRQMCRFLIWRRASLVLSDAGLVAECADSLRRQLCSKTTGLVHPATPISVCAMHAGDQTGAPEAPTPHSGVGQPGRPCHASPCSAVREHSKGCDSVVMILFKHTACSEGLSHLCMVRPAPDIESSTSARRAWLVCCTPACSLSMQLQLHIAFKSSSICRSISLQCLQGELHMSVTRPASGVECQWLLRGPCWRHMAPAWSLTVRFIFCMDSK